MAPEAHGMTSTNQRLHLQELEGQAHGSATNRPIRQVPEDGKPNTKPQEDYATQIWLNLSRSPTCLIPRIKIFHRSYVQRRGPPNFGQVPFRGATVVLALCPPRRLFTPYPQSFSNSSSVSHLRQWEPRIAQEYPQMIPWCLVFSLIQERLKVVTQILINNMISRLLTWWTLRYATHAGQQQH